MRRGLRRTILTALPALAASALAAASSASALAATTEAAAKGKQQAPSEIALPVSLSGPSAQVTMPPVGLSLEYPVMAEDLGAGGCPPPALVATLQQLGSPPLALSGDSQDLTAPAGMLANPAPSWETATLYQLPSTFWSQLHCLLLSTKDPLDVGLNMRTGSPTWATMMVAGAQSAATNGLEFSLGNEPDLYFLPNYASLAKAIPGKEVKAVNVYLALAGALEQTLGGAPVIGPEMAISALWRRQLPRIVATLHERTLGVHLYPLTACNGPSGVTLAKLLAPAAAQAPAQLAWVVNDANAAGIPAVISEANSASCGGQAGVSDSPAAAVWAVRYVLSALKTGFREVRFHFSNGAYDPFVMRDGLVYDRPLESALVALNQWLPVGTKLQTVRSVHGVLATAVAGNTASPELILDNEQTKPQTVVLRGVAAAQVEVLNAERAGLQVGQLNGSDGRVRVTVSPNSVVAVKPAAG